MNAHRNIGFFHVCLNKRPDCGLQHCEITVLNVVAEGKSSLLEKLFRRMVTRHCRAIPSPLPHRTSPVLNNTSILQKTSYMYSVLVLCVMQVCISCSYTTTPAWRQSSCGFTNNNFFGLCLQLLIVVIENSSDFPCMMPTSEDKAETDLGDGGGGGAGRRVVEQAVKVDVVHAL
jgi:hypothetical protein